MRRHLWTAATVIVLLAFPASAEHHENALKEEVAAVGDRITQAMIAGEFESMLSLYADDAISLPNFGTRLNGHEDLRRHHAEMVASGMKINAFESEPTDVWEAGDQVIEIGTFTISLDLPGMPGVDDVGKYMNVYVRDDDGNLKIKAETWNTDMNPMEMGPPPAAESE